MDILLFYKVNSLLNALVATVLGFVIYFRNRKQLVNKLFSLFFAFVAIWSYAYFFWFTIKNGDFILFNFRFLLMGSAIFINILFFHSILALTNKIKEYKKFLVVGYLIFFFFLIADYFTPLFLKGFHKESFFDFWPKPGILYHPYFAITYLYLIISFYVLIKEIKASKTNSYYRTQLKYILIGAIIGFIGSIPNYLFWYNVYFISIPIAPVTNFLVVVGMIIVAYNIVKHHLFNIKLLVSEILIFSIWTFVIIRTALSNNAQELLTNGVLVFLVFIAGILLLRSVSKETELTQKLLEETQHNLELEKRIREKMTQKTKEVIKKMENITRE